MQCSTLGRPELRRTVLVRFFSIPLFIRAVEKSENWKSGKIRASILGPVDQCSSAEPMCSKTRAREDLGEWGNVWRWRLPCTTVLAYVRRKRSESRANRAQCRASRDVHRRTPHML